MFKEFLPQSSLTFEIIKRDLTCAPKLLLHAYININFYSPLYVACNRKLT
jgi:hypothetical protein